MTAFFKVVHWLKSIGGIGVTDSAHRPLRQLRQQASVFLISIGVSLLLLTAGSYEWMRLEQQRLMDGLQAQYKNTAVSSRDSQQMTLLTIPKINLKAVIVDGTSPRSLLLAPGHLESTAQPGDPGNSVIAGHRDTFFRRIHELERGDEILVTRAGRQFHYIVTNKTVVNPDVVGVTLPSKDTRLTLVTCYPTYYIGPAPKRLIVVAQRQQTDQGKTPLPTVARTSSP